MKQCFLGYMHDHLWRNLTLVFGLCLMGLIMVLYQIPKQTILYCLEFALVIIFCSMLVEYYRYYKSFYARRNLLQSIQYHTTEELPPAINYMEEEYREIIHQLFKEKKEELDRKEASYQELKDYIMMWAHQIKTPIAAMRLTLQNTDSSFSRKLSVELARVEQYVDMVLCYFRLDTDTRDYVIAVYDLDDILRQALRKFAGQFIGKKIHLDYQPLNAQIMTDEKWLLFVIEQILSNALKYTQQGCVSIYLESPKILCIRDTGMGIAAEDLPRIFEKGYTGYNGRTDKKASGLGLYLCARICRNLGHGISAESEPDKGTVIKLNLNTAERMFE